eukprot:scaffold6447_cov19-Prasinocladus_malaysianus.AAC.1
MSESNTNNKNGEGSTIFQSSQTNSKAWTEDRGYQPGNYPVRAISNCLRELHDNFGLIRTKYHTPSPTYV